MPLGDLLAILAMPPVVGVYYGSLVLAVSARTLGSADAAMREAERAAVFMTAAATIPALLGFLASLAIRG